MSSTIFGQVQHFVIWQQVKSSPSDTLCSMYDVNIFSNNKDIVKCKVFAREGYHQWQYGYDNISKFLWKEKPSSRVGYSGTC